MSLPISMPAGPPPPADLDRSYAQWYEWAQGQYAEPRQAHVAADAAVAALVGGATAEAAVDAGRRAAEGPELTGHHWFTDNATRVYGSWFHFARHRVGLDPDRAHAAALAGREAQAAGLPVAEAQARALGAAGVTISPPSRAGGLGLSWRDPALRAIVYGAVCLVMPFVGFYFIVLPFLGLVYSIRALTQSRLVYGIIGVVLNGLASALTAALFFHLV